MEAAADAWADQGNPRPVLSFAASSALARQIEAGAEAGLFVSADEAWMDTVARSGAIADNSRADLVTNRLVLIAPAEDDSAFALGDLRRELGDGRLAMADPDAVPAGRYARQALGSLGLWDRVKDRIASAENVRVALALVARGEAPFGVVYATDALAEPGVRVNATFPADSHEPIRYPVARLRSSQGPDAEAFRAFLLSPEGQAIFARFGFGPA